MASLRIFLETVLVYTCTLLQVVEHKTLFDWIQGLIALSNYIEIANDNKLVLNPPRVGEERRGVDSKPLASEDAKGPASLQCTCFWCSQSVEGRYPHQCLRLLQQPWVELVLRNPHAAVSLSTSLHLVFVFE